MAKITKVRTSVKEDKVLAIIMIQGQEAPIFLTDKQIQAATGLKNNFSVLKGGDIEVTYYVTGEKMISGAECTKDNTIVKEFDIELPDNLTKIAGAVAFGASMF